MARRKDTIPQRAIRRSARRWGAIVDDAQGGEGSAASLAAAVLEEEDAREDRAQARPRAGHLPRRAPARRQLRAGVVHGRVPGRRQAHVHRARAPARVRRARGRGHQRARARDPADVRDQRGRDRLHRDGVVGVLRARRGPDGVARRPRQARADRRAGRASRSGSSCSPRVWPRARSCSSGHGSRPASPRRTASRCTSR